METRTGNKLGRRFWAAGAFWGVMAVLLAGLWLTGIGQTPLIIRNPVLHHTEPIGEIRGAQTVGQTFLAPYPGLNRIDVSLADYGRLNVGQVLFKVKSSPEAAEAIRVVSFPADSIRGDVMYSASFAPIPDSAGKTYYFALEASEAAPGNAITAYIRPPEGYTDGTAYWAGQPRDGDLVFTLHFQVSWLERAQILLRQMTTNKPSVLGTPLLLLVVAGAYVALLVALAWQATRLLAGPATQAEADPGAEIVKPDAQQHGE